MDGLDRIMCEYSERRRNMSASEASVSEACRHNSRVAQQNLRNQEKMARATRTYAYDCPEWELALVRRIKINKESITKLQVEEEYKRQKEYRRQSEKAGNDALKNDPTAGKDVMEEQFRENEAARKYAERFCARHGFVVRREAFKTSKTAIELWQACCENYETYDRIRRAIEKDFMSHCSNLGSTTTSLMVTQLNTDETMIRDQMETNNVLISRTAKAADRSAQCNKKETMQGASLIAYLSSTKNFSVYPGLIMHKGRPNRFIKGQILTSLNNVYSNATFFVKGNKNGVAWTDSMVWATETDKVLRTWRAYRDEQEAKGVRDYLVWYSVFLWEYESRAP